MKLTNDCEFASERPTASASLDRNDFERGYEDDDRFERPRLFLRSPLAGPAVRQPPASTVEHDDDLDDTALHFSGQ